MKTSIGQHIRRAALALALPLGAMLCVPAAAQMQTVDPDDVIDADLMDGYEAGDTTASDYDTTYSVEEATPRYEAEQDPRPALDLPPAGEEYVEASANVDSGIEAAAENASGTYGEDDLIGAAEGLFGE